MSSRVAYPGHGTEKHKNLLKGLLENVFGREIKDIEYGSTEQLGESLDSRNSYFDVLCHAMEGPDFIVECQVREVSIHSAMRG